MMRAVCLAGALVFALPPLLVTAASAEVVKLQAELKGSNEVPPNTSSGSGKAEAAFDSDTKILTETQAADLLAGKWYANIHTAANPGGELRGQMAK